MLIHPEFHARYGPVAVVAGASEGIGRAYAHQLAEWGLDLILIARRAGPLEAEAHLLRRRHGVRVDAVPMDLASSDLEANFSAAIEGRDVGLLIYNACHSDIREFSEMSVASMMTTIDVNVRGPVLLSSLMTPRLIERGRGGLLIMSSMSGFQGTALISTYAASKAFDTAFGEALWTELGPKGVDVLVCVAGATLTPSFNEQTPEEKRPGVFPMKPEDVAIGALEHLRDGPVYIAGGMNRAVATGMRLAGRKIATSFISSQTRKVYG